MLANFGKALVDVLFVEEEDLKRDEKLWIIGHGLWRTYYSGTREEAANYAEKVMHLESYSLTPCEDRSDLYK